MENISTDKDDFMLHWLPNCEEMIQKVLKNKNVIIYPTKSTDMSNYKVFDFTSQRIIGDHEDDFISVDQKQASKQKVKPGKKAIPTATTTSTKKTATKSPQTSAPTKMRVTQTITTLPDWKVIADFNKLTLEKLRLENIEPEVEDKLICGSLYQISDEFEKDKTNSLNPVHLQRYDKFKFFGNISTLEDEKMKTATEFANVFVTDKILSVIMTCVYNSRPWHLKITKVGESIFIDKMANSEIDLVTVNESDNSPQDEDDKQIDSFKNLAIEATLINEFIKEQVLNQASKFEDVDQPHPFVDESEEDVEHLAYRYRLWKVGDMDVLVRCQVHAFDYNDDGDISYVNVYALNEYDVICLLTFRGILTYPRNNSRHPICSRRKCRTTILKSPSGE